MCQRSTRSVDAALSKDLVHDSRDRRGRVDDHTIVGEILLGLMQAHDEFTLLRSSAPLVVWSALQPPPQGVRVDIEDENAVEEVNEGVEVPGTTAEEGHRLALVRDQSLDLVHLPQVVLVRAAGDRLPSLRITLIGELPVPMHGVVAAPLQLGTNRGLPSAGDALNQEVSDAHRWMIRATRPEEAVDTIRRDVSLMLVCMSKSVAGHRTLHVARSA